LLPLGLTDTFFCVRGFELLGRKGRRQNVGEEGQGAGWEEGGEARIDETCGECNILDLLLFLVPSILSYLLGFLLWFCLLRSVACASSWCSWSFGYRVFLLDEGCQYLLLCYEQENLVEVQ
jgi:hypothetical protein